MWGPPTDKKVLFDGREGYDNLFDLADAAVRKEYSFPEIFADVHACSLPERDYGVLSYDELRRILDDTTKIYGHPDDKEMIYALASRCVVLDGSYANFRMFSVGSGSLSSNYLYNSCNDAYSFIYAVRPEAIPKATMCLNMEGRDGSKENPWLCIGS